MYYMPKAINGKKKCTNCKETLDVSEYHKDKTNSDGLNRICKTCAKKFRSLPERKSKEAFRETQYKYKSRKKKYNESDKGRLYHSKEKHTYISKMRGVIVEHTLTFDEWNKILDGQKNRCAVCGVRCGF